MVDQLPKHGGLFRFCLFSFFSTTVLQKNYLMEVQIEGSIGIIKLEFELGQT